LFFPSETKKREWLMPILILINKNKEQQ